MLSIQVLNNEGQHIKRFEINHFGYGVDYFCARILSKYQIRQILSKEDLIQILSELDGKIGKKSSGMLLYYAFLNKEDNFTFQLGW